MSRSRSRSPSFLMTTVSSAFAEEVSGIAIPKAASAAKAMANFRIEFPPCVYRIFDSAWTQRTEGVSSSPIESKAGSRNPDPTATDQCASPAGTETTAPQQYRSFSVCLALSLVPLRPWRDCDCQAGDDHSLAPRWVSSVLALAIAQPCWQTEGLG